MALKPILWLQEAVPGTSREAAYRLARQFPEITVRLGRRVFISEERFWTFIAEGGRGLAGGWRHDPGPSVEPRDAA